jgi:hypothetical protein
MELSQCLSTINLTYNGLGSNPGVCIEMQVIDRQQCQHYMKLRASLFWDFKQRRLIVS